MLLRSPPPSPSFADTHHAHTRIAGARIDLYLIQCKTYLSEVTMTSAAGGSVVKPGKGCFGDCAKRVDEWLGSLISRELPLESQIRRHHLKASCSSSHPYSSPSAPSSAPSSSATSFSPPSISSGGLRVPSYPRSYPAGSVKPRGGGSRGWTRSKAKWQKRAFHPREKGQQGGREERG